LQVLIVVAFICIVDYFTGSWVEEAVLQTNGGKSYSHFLTKFLLKLLMKIC